MNPLNLIKQYWQKDLLPLLADLKFAIVLFLLIALASMTGTVIEQGQSVNFYQINYPESPALFGFLTWKVILTLGLDQVYKTWWFFSLLILFGSSLTACSFTRQIPSLKAAQSWIFYREPRQFEKLVLSTSIPALSAEQWRSLPAYLQQRGYKCFLDVPPAQSHIPDSEHLTKPADPESPASENAQPETQVLYARKGIVGRIGPIIVHISLLILIAGTIVGSLTGFFAQEMIPSGETFQVKHIFEAGRWAAPQVPKDWAVRVNRFWIDYSPEGRVDQFYSDLSVVDPQGQELRHKVIHVNEPLRYRGVTFYQADWAIGAIRVSFNNSPILQLPLAQIEVPGGRIWGTWLPTAPDLSQGVSLVAKDLQGTVMLYDNQGQPLGTLRVGMTQEVNGVKLTLHELVGSTGLQIKADPGVPIVYLGFGLLMISVLMSYVSHSQLWLLQTPQRLYVGGRTNRAQVAFERELLNLFSDLATSDTVQANMVQANSGNP